MHNFVGRPKIGNKQSDQTVVAWSTVADLRWHYHVVGGEL